MLSGSAFLLGMCDGILGARWGCRNLRAGNGCERIAGAAGEIDITGFAGGAGEGLEHGEDYGLINMTIKSFEIDGVAWLMYRIGKGM